MPTLHLHRQRPDQQFVLRFRNLAFDIDLVLSRREFPSTVQALRHGHGEWREWEFHARLARSTRA